MPSLVRLRNGAQWAAAICSCVGADPEHLVYDPPKAGPGGSGPQCLTPLELLDRLAALVPPPRVHRHRYFGVLAPNSPLRAAVTALAPVAVPTPPAHPPEPSATEPAHRRATAHRAGPRLAAMGPVRCQDG